MSNALKLLIDENKFSQIHSNTLIALINETTLHINKNTKYMRFEWGRLLVLSRTIILTCKYLNVEIVILVNYMNVKILIFISGLIAYAVVWGNSGSSALLYGALLDIHENSTMPLLEAQLALIGGLNNGLSYFSCLFVGKLVNILGCRLVIIIGIGLASSGAFLSSFLPCAPIWLWWITCRLMTGIGNGLINVPTIVALEQYFDRWFSLAYGIVAA